MISDKYSIFSSISVTVKYGVLLKSHVIPNLVNLVAPVPSLPIIDTLNGVLLSKPFSISSLLLLIAKLST